MRNKIFYTLIGLFLFTTIGYSQNIGNKLYNHYQQINPGKVTVKVDPFSIVSPLEQLEIHNEHLNDFFCFRTR